MNSLETNRWRATVMAAGAVFSAGVVVASLRWPGLANGLVFALVIPVVLISLSKGLGAVSSHVAGALFLAWLTGYLNPVRDWVQTAMIQTGVFLGAAAACFLAKRVLLDEIRRQCDEVAATQTHAVALQSKVEQLNAEVNKSIFDILAIYEFTTVLGSTLNLHEMFEMMVDTIMRVVRYDACFLVLVDERTGELDVRGARAFTLEELDRFSKAKVGQGILGKVLQTAQPLIVPNLEEQEWSREYQKLRYGSMLAIPLVIHGKAIGALCLFKEGKDGFNPDDLRVLFIVANQCAFAVQNGKLYEETARLAITDGLTELYNHRYFRICIEQAVGRAEKTGSPVSMIMADVDGFKGVNDKYGHQRGDQVLQQMAGVIAQAVRESDLVARYGGEEFAVILPDTGPKEAYQVAARIHKAVSDTDFDGLRLTLSVGVATYPAGDVDSKDDLISRADQYAYQAKQEGRNRICTSNW